mmetsp:Transcript_12635/g.37998  ORF Transcript_12635/g.37998 Transcript_12635/m.37998 type:complete len:214 (+) Transcript_12635:663-1304(+)
MKRSTAPSTAASSFCAMERCFPRGVPATCSSSFLSCSTRLLAFLPGLAGLGASGGASARAFCSAPCICCCHASMSLWSSPSTEARMACAQPTMGVAPDRCPTRTECTAREPRLRATPRSTSRSAKAARGPWDASAAPLSPSGLRRLNSASASASSRSRRVRSASICWRTWRSSRESPSLAIARPRSSVLAWRSALSSASWSCACFTSGAVPPL